MFSSFEKGGKFPKRYSHISFCLFHFLTLADLFCLFSTFVDSAKIFHVLFCLFSIYFYRTDFNSECQIPQRRVNIHKGVFCLFVSDNVSNFSLKRPISKKKIEFSEPNFFNHIAGNDLAIFSTGFKSNELSVII